MKSLVGFMCVPFPISAFNDLVCGVAGVAGADILVKGLIDVGPILCTSDVFVCVVVVGTMVLCLGYITYPIYPKYSVGCMSDW